MTDYLIKSPAVSKTKPPKSVSVDMNANLDDSSIQTPKSHPNPSSTVTPYSGNGIDLSYLADADSSTCAEAIDYTKIYSGCNKPFHSCYEGQWCKICLHTVLDYLEKKDFENVSERSVRKVFYNTFLLMMKAEVLKETELYKLEDHIHLPECMRKGSLTEALELMDHDIAYKFMKSVGVHDVQRHLYRMKNGNVFRDKCKEGERIVKA